MPYPAIVYIAKANSFFEFAIGLVVSAVSASLAIEAIAFALISITA